MIVLYVVSNSGLMDGINRHVLSVASSLNSMNCGVTPVVVTLHKRGDLNAALDRAGVRNYAIGARNGHDIRSVLRFARIMAEVRPDIVHYHVLGFLLRVFLKFKYQHVRFVTTIHGISRSAIRPTFENRIERMLVRLFNLRLTGLIYISNGVREFFGGGRSQIPVVDTIYNPLKFCAIENGANPLRCLLGVGEDVKVIGTACRFDEVKNPIAFVSVMAGVLSRLPKVHAVLLGDGPEKIKSAMQRVIETARLGDRFHWLGYRPDAPDLVRGFDCFVMTSNCEGMPTSLLECMTQQVPFAFMEGYGGLRDLSELNSKRGPIAVVAAAGDVSGMVDRVVDLMSDPRKAREIAARAYDVGKSVFDTSVVMSQMVDFYSRVMEVENEIF